MYWRRRYQGNEMTKIQELLALAQDLRRSNYEDGSTCTVSRDVRDKAAASLREYAGMLGTVQKLRPDFLAGYDAGMKDMAHMIDAKIAEQPLAEPVAWLAAYVNSDGLPDVFVTTHRELAIENDANRSPKPLYLGREK